MTQPNQYEDDSNSLEFDAIKTDQYEDKGLLDELMHIIPQITDVQYLRVKQLITQKQLEAKLEELENTAMYKTYPQKWAIERKKVLLAELTKQEGKG
jgi:hypothetical protein